MKNHLREILAAGLLDSFDSAFLLFDFEELDSKLETLSEQFPKATYHTVAIKTNPIAAVLEHIVRQGMGLEAASFEELILAEKAGASPEQLIFDSPVKRQWEIDACAERWPGMIVNANSIQELSRYKAHEQLRIGLRINPLVDLPSEERYNVSLATSKFGVSVDHHDEIVRACINFPVTGLHMHSGSRITDPLANVKGVKKLLHLGLEVNNALKERGELRRIEFLDIGGGLLPDLGKHGMTVFAGAIANLKNLENFELITEFGQWIHSDAGMAFSRVEYVNLTQGEVARAFIHLGADYFMRDVYTISRNFGFRAFDSNGHSIEDRHKQRYQLPGPLCFAGDFLTEQVELPELNEHDWIEISRTGANTYGLWSRHCSRDIPKVIGWSQTEGYSILQKRTPIRF